MDSRRASPAGRRILAALALSAKTVGEAAADLHLSQKTLQRTIRGERLLRDHEARQLAEHTGVPIWFIRDGLSRLSPPSEPVLNGKAEVVLEAVATRLGLLERNTEEAFALLQEELAVIKQRLTRRAAA